MEVLLSGIVEPVNSLNITATVVGVSVVKTFGKDGMYKSLTLEDISILK